MARRKEEGDIIEDVLMNKAATIERCVARAREAYEKGPETFAADYTRQDAAILNIQRACEAALAMGHHLIRRDRLGIYQSARDVFSLLARSGRMEVEMAERLKRMVGFRNLAVHEYQTVQMAIVETIIRRHLDDLLAYGERMLQQEA